MNPFFPGAFYEHKGRRLGPYITTDIVNQIGLDLEATQKALGLNPASSAATVDARIAALETGAATINGACIALRLGNNPGQINSRVDIAADLIVVEGMPLQGVVASADIALSGAQGSSGLGGRDDVTTEAIDTWYAVWLGYNPSSQLYKGMVSSSFTRGITTGTGFPGYTRWRRVGAVRNDHNSNFLRFAQEGHEVLYQGNNNLVVNGSTNGITSTPGNKNFAEFVPPTSRLGLLNITVLSTVFATAGALQSSATSANNWIDVAQWPARTSGNNVAFTQQHRQRLDANRACDWQGTNAAYDNAYAIGVSGFVDNVC